jgi:phage baseplate assembly protein gpV
VAGGSDAAVTEAANAYAQHAAGSFAEAEGQCLGDARLVAGATVDISGVPAPFAGSWVATAARHVFDGERGGYHTFFTVSGQGDRSFLGLTGGGAVDQNRTNPGVCCGIVSEIDDPLNLGRVKVVLPWLAPDYVTDWAPVVQLGAAKSSGARFLPEPKEQVLVGFEHGDLRRPYVLGSLLTKNSGEGADLGGPAVKPGTPAAVIRRGIVTPSGNHLLFHDEVPPSGGTATASEVVLGTKDAKIALTLDQKAGTLKITCDPGSPSGTITIDCGGDVILNAKGKLAITAGSELQLKGQAVKIAGTEVEISGDAAVKVAGGVIKLN